MTIVGGKNGMTIDILKWSYRCDACGKTIGPFEVNDADPIGWHEFMDMNIACSEACIAKVKAKWIKNRLTWAKEIYQREADEEFGNAEPYASKRGAS